VSAFDSLFRRTGGYSLPWLITIGNGDTTLYYINDTVDREYSGETYKARTFEYTPNPEEHGFIGGGTLEIATADAWEVDSINAFIESSSQVSMTVIGILLDDDSVTELKTFYHSYGSVQWDGKKASFSFDADDRLTMTFPALIFSHYNNRGNG
jgi:hypothetical protein